MQTIKDLIVVDSHCLTLDRLVKDLRGKKTRDGYQVSARHGETITAAIAAIDAAFAAVAPSTLPASTPDTSATQEPSAAPDRQIPLRSHPLGRAVRRETGCTVYADTTFGGGTVRIYDES